MDAQKKKSVLNQKKSEKLPPLEERRTLRNLHFHKSNPRIASNLSSAAAAAASIEARNGCLRFSRSSNSSSDASLPSSTSRINFERKPKSLPRVATIFPAKSFRSKENEVPRKPTSEKSRKMQQLGVDGRGTGKSKTNPVSKAAQVSKLSRGRGNSVKSSEELGRKKLKNTGTCEPPLKSSTPAGSSSVRRNVAEESDLGKANSGSGSATLVKTPPVEVSVSPEIQSKMLVSKSAATPVCYGAGHLLSGVTDKRKCRRRGSLRGGFEKVKLFYDEKIDKNAVDDSQDSSIPLPAEASVRWLLSPCNEDRGSDSEGKLEEYDMSCGNGSLSLDVLSSPPTLCGDAFELGCENSDFNLREAATFMLSPQENCEFESWLGSSVKKMFDPFLAATPSSVSNCNGLSLREGDNVGLSVSGNSSGMSLCSLSSGNIIQTPNSDCSSYEYIRRRSNVEGDKRSFVEFELDSVTETLDAVSLPSRSKSFPYAGLGSSSCSIPPIRLEKDVESFRSWESGSTLENLTLSQMKISWRDGVGCKTDELDEIDCCPRLSDEATDAFMCCDQQLKPYGLSQSGGDEGNKRVGKDARIDDDVSPIVLKYEPCIRAAPKDKSSGDRLGECAESICTIGGDLAVSSDSDWRVTCFRSSNHNCKA